MPDSEGRTEPVARCRFIPAYLLERLRDGDDDTLTRCAAATLAHDEALRVRRTTALPAAAVAGAWAIHTAG
ncbi:MAG: hypothetical protein JWO46_2090, partial [Nocardioidaceae bacterium]|nr:hypothetical protein [Nocardioidaceae bacterium]